MFLIPEADEFKELVVTSDMAPVEGKVTAQLYSENTWVTLGIESRKTGHLSFRILRIRRTNQRTPQERIASSFGRSTCSDTDHAVRAAKSVGHARRVAEEALVQRHVC